MSDQSFELWYQEIIAGCAPWLEGAIHDAWARCLPIWREHGRIEDNRFVTRIHRPHYEPWWGKYLAQEFTRRFRDDYRFIVALLSSDDEFVRASAVDLLKYLCANFGDQPIP